LPDTADTRSTIEQYRQRIALDYSAVSPGLESQRLRKSVDAASERLIDTTRM